jgi:hypothetical protein
MAPNTCDRPFTYTCRTANGDRVASPPCRASPRLESGPCLTLGHSSASCCDLVLNTRNVSDSRRECLVRRPQILSSACRASQRTSARRPAAPRPRQPSRRPPAVPPLGRPAARCPPPRRSAAPLPAAPPLGGPAAHRPAARRPRSPSPCCLAARRPGRSPWPSAGPAVARHGSGRSGRYPRRRCRSGLPLFSAVVALGGIRGPDAALGYHLRQGHSRRLDLLLPPGPSTTAWSGHF